MQNWNGSGILQDDIFLKIYKFSEIKLVSVSGKSSQGRWGIEHEEIRFLPMMFCGKRLLQRNLSESGGEGDVSLWLIKTLSVAFGSDCNESIMEPVNKDVKEAVLSKFSLYFVVVLRRFEWVI